MGSPFPDGFDPITQLLRSWRQGDKVAADQVFSLVYAELRRLADSYLRRERPDHTLQPTALIHEAYLRLAGQKEVDWQNRSHFYGVAAHLMRLILTDYARSHLSAKRGSGDRKVPLEEGALASNSHPEDLLALDEALEALARLDERKCRILEMRFFAGMTPEETAIALGVSEPTIRREVRLARAFLRQRLTLEEKAEPA
jgi:RNA polymerase sigma factor (TIGR02999 family)